jgi:hypothetical protein
LRVENCFAHVRLSPVPRCFSNVEGPSSLAFVIRDAQRQEQSYTVSHYSVISSKLAAMLRSLSVDASLKDIASFR